MSDDAAVDNTPATEGELSALMQSLSEEPASDSAPDTTAPAETDTTTETPSETPVQETTPTASPEAQPETTPAPPEHRWPSILANQREKAATEERAKHQDAIALQEAYQRDPVGFLERARAAIAADPRFGDRVTPAETPAAIEPDVKTEDGKLLLSADLQRQLVEQKATEVLSAATEKIDALSAQVDTLTQATATKDAADEASAKVTGLSQDLMARPHFAQIKDDLVTRIGQVSDEDLSRLGLAMVAERAYSDLLVEKVLPSMDATAETRVLDDLKTKAQAGTERPGAGAPETTKDPETVEELADYMKHLARAEATA